MKDPWLIQRCELTADGKLRYDYMGSTEYEIGDQAKSLKRIFALGFAQDTETIRVKGQDVTVYLLAGNGFKFSLYQPYLEQLVENKLRLQERTNFDEAVKLHVGQKSWLSSPPDAWFDFENDVLWTLNEKRRANLLLALLEIQKKWSEKV